MTTKTTLAISRPTDANLRPWRPGQSGNPAGRPLGSRHRIAEDVYSKLADDFERHGAAVIQRVRDEDPSTYLRLIAGLVPRNVEVLAATMDSQCNTVEAIDAEIVKELRRIGYEITKWGDSDKALEFAAGG